MSKRQKRTGILSLFVCLFIFMGAAVLSVFGFTAKADAAAYTLTFAEEKSLSDSADGWSVAGKETGGISYSEGIVSIDYDGGTNNDGILAIRSGLNLVNGEQYGVSIDYKGVNGVASFHLYVGETVIQAWLGAVDTGWTNYTAEFTFDGNDYALLKWVGDSKNLQVKNFVISKKYDTRAMEDDAAIGELPTIPKKEGYRGYWTIDGVEISATTKYTFGADKTAKLVYEKAGTKYTLTFAEETENLAGSIDGWSNAGVGTNGIAASNGEIQVDFNTVSTANYYNVSVFNSVNGKTYTIKYEHKSTGTGNSADYHLFHGNWSGAIKDWIGAPTEWSEQTISYTANTNGETLIFQSAGGNKSLQFRNFTITEVVNTREIEDNAAIGELPTIPKKEGYRGYWTIDGVEISATTKYTFGANKTAKLVYEELAVEKNSVSGVSISLNGDIALNFYVKVIDDAKVYFTVDGVKTETANYVAKDGENYNRVYSCSVAAKDYDKNILLTIGDDDKQISAQASVKQYIAVAKTEYQSNEELLALINALEKYCEAAKKYFAKESVQNVDFADENIVNYKAAKSGTLPAGVTIKVSLILETKTTIRIYLSGENAATIACKIDGVAVTPIEKDGSYYIEKAGIAAKDLDKTYTFDIGSASVYFSAFSYVQAVAEQNSDANLVKTVKALYNYGVAANVYFPDAESVSAKTDMSKTVALANKLENGVQGSYLGANKSLYTVSNGNMTLTHRLNREASGMLVSALKAKNGGVYLSDTIDPYLTVADKTVYGSVSKNIQRYSVTDGTTPLSEAACSPYINVNKFGYYYYQVNVRNLNFGNDLYLDKTYHIYSDRMYQQYRLINNGTQAATADVFGFEAKISLSAISEFEIYDGTERVSSIEQSGAGRAFSSLQYAAFDISGVGVVAFINTCENCTFWIINTGDYIYVRQYVAVGTLNAKASMEFGSRIYTDYAHNFDGVKAANEIERNPLTAGNISVSGDGAEFVGYNNITGYYVFKINGTTFAQAAADPDKKYIEKITVNSPDEREVFFYVHSTSLLEGAAITDENNLLMPIGVQVSKNFDHEKEEPIYDPNDEMYGDTIFPFAAEKNKSITLSVVNVYQNWGKYAAKQLSSVSYYVAYYHLSTGVRETNCIAPYFATFENKDDYGAWILPDFRGASCDGQAKTVGTADSIQKNSVGEMSGVSNGTDSGVYQSSQINSEGLVYADLNYSYISADGAYKYAYRHVEMPQNDESRTYYTVEIEFLKNTSLKYSEFRIFGFGPVTGGKNYSKAVYIGTDGKVTEINPSQNINSTSVIINKFTPKLYALQKGSSYFAYYGLESSGREQGNFGLIVKNYAITVNGVASDMGLALYNDRVSKGGSYVNRASLTIAQDTTFVQGDKIIVNVILLPYGTATQTDYANVKKVYEDSVMNAIAVNAEVGTAVSDEYVPTISTTNNIAVFTLSGGCSENNAVGVNYAINVSGINKLGRLKVEKMNENGEWEEVVFSSESGFDGYSVKYENEKFDYSFIVTKTTTSATYRVTVA